MKSIWQNGKMTAAGKRMAALALALCFLVSFVQNIASKPIFADEAVSETDVIAENTIDSSNNTELSESDSNYIGLNVVLSYEASGSDVSSTDVSDTDASNSDIDIENDWEDEYSEPRILLRTDKAVGSKLNLSFTATAEIKIDWGDGNIVPYSADGVTAGSWINIYCDGAITEFSCPGNELSLLSVYNCTTLRYLDCSNNNLPLIDGRLPKLTELNCSSNQIAVLYDDYEKLEILNCEDNDLGWLDQISDSDLRELYCGSNRLTELSLKNCPSIEKLDCSGNKLTRLDVSDCSSLSYLKCDSNKLKYSALPDNAASYSTYDYAPQGKLSAAKAVGAGVELDMSSEYDVDGNKTVFTWYDSSDDSEVTPTTENDGVFTFGEEFVGKYLYCKMTNSAFSGLTITTTEIKIVESGASFDKPQITMVTAKEKGSKLNLSFTASEQVYIDWGDGNIVPWSADGITADEEIKIYCGGDITKLVCSSNDLTDLIIENCTALEYLDCSSNKIVDLDVRNNTGLSIIYCQNNKIDQLQLYGLPELTELRCDNNNLKFLYFDYEYANLSYVNFSSNPGAEVYGGGEWSNRTPAPEEVIMNDCLLEDVDFFSGYDEAKWIECAGNELLFSDLPQPSDNNTTYNYSPQSEVEITKSLKPGTSIDLSSEYQVYGTGTAYTWYDASDDSVVTPTKTTKGVFTFGAEFEGKTLYCVMTNSLFPALTLTTTEVKVEDTITNFGEPLAIITTDAEAGSNMDFYFTTKNYDEPEVYIDWGDGNIVRYSDDGVTAGNTVRIYGISDITGMEVINGEINCLDISGNTSLRWINCYDSSVDKINASGCKALSSMGCDNIDLAELDVSGCILMDSLYCSGNKLTSLDLSDNSALVWLNCQNNEISELIIPSKYMSLEGGCQNNRLRFSTIPLNITGVVIEESGYAPQADFEIAASVNAGDAIDLSSEYDVEGFITVYTWHDAADDSVVTPATAENGVFTFGNEMDGKSLYCTMTNEWFRHLTLKTTVVEIIGTDEPEETPEEPEVSDGDLAIQDPDGIIIDTEVEEGTKFEDADGNARVEGELVLIVGNVEDNKKKSVLEAIEAYNNTFNSDDNNHAMYDISLETKSGIKVTEIDGRILIGIKYPDNLAGKNTDYDFHLYHQKNDGTIEEVTITCKPNGIWFYADEFSPYVLTWSLKNTVNGESDSNVDSDTPSTGDYSNISAITVYFTLSFAALLAFAWYGIGKRRKVRS